jgi:hypothetical protein
VDRHYLEEYTAYYARSLTPPPAHAARLHIFSDGMGPDEFKAHLIRAASGEQDAVEAAVNERYLGYVTVRPIPSAPIGRTVLSHYGIEVDRRYDPASTVHIARLCGLALEVPSLPFQQQDQAVGACATTAAWAALSRAARATGSRAPTPYAVTAAATRHVVNDRDLPAVGGLELAQMTTAIRELGFTPYVVKAWRRDSYAEFVFTLKTYLRSGIPAVLYLGEEGKAAYHAVTVAGYKCSAGQPLQIRGPKALEHDVLITQGLTRLYVHDDCIGPYVKMQLEPPPPGESHPRLTRPAVDRDDDSLNDVPPGTMVNYAVFPLYPKLRLSAPDLIEEACALVPLVRQLLGANRMGELSAECLFALNGDYLRDLFALGVKPPDRLVELARHVVLSRHVGVIRWFLRDEALADVICDTTDIAREDPPHCAVLAAVMFSRNLVPQFQKYLPEVIVV